MNDISWINTREYSNNKTEIISNLKLESAKEKKVSFVDYELDNSLFSINSWYIWWNQSHEIKWTKPGSNDKVTLRLAEDEKIKSLLEKGKNRLFLSYSEDASDEIKEAKLIGIISIEEGIGIWNDYRHNELVTKFKTQLTDLQKDHEVEQKLRIQAEEEVLRMKKISEKLNKKKRWDEFIDWSDSTSVQTQTKRLSLFVLFILFVFFICWKLFEFTGLFHRINKRFNLNFQTKRMLREENLEIKKSYKKLESAINKVVINEKQEIEQMNG